MRGLPQKRAYETVLRDGMAIDSLEPVGIYMGTRSGQLFGTRDEGKTWHRILDGLPAIVCVRAVLVADPAEAPARKTSSASQADSKGRKSSSRKSSSHVKR